MRIGLVIERFVPALGGAEQWTFQFARWLLGHGHEVHVVAHDFNEQLNDMNIIRQRLERPRSRLEFAESAERKIRSLNLDVVHDMGRGWFCDVFQPHNGSRCAAFRQNLLMEPTWKRPLKHWAQRWLPRYREFDRLQSKQFDAQDRVHLAVSQMVANDLQRYHRVPSESIRVIHNGVDIERFSPTACQGTREKLRQKLHVNADETLLLLVAHNLRLKGLPTLLRSLSQLRGEGHPVRLAVVGGKRLSRFGRLARRNGVADVTSLIGMVGDPVPYYAAADVYVQATYYDPCSLVALEALACGLPVVTSRFNGVSELMTDGVEGCLLDDPGSAEELTKCLGPLLDQQQRKTMGVAARQLATAHSLERNFQQIIDLYHDISNSTRAAA